MSHPILYILYLVVGILCVLNVYFGTLLTFLELVIFLIGYQSLSWLGL